MFNIQCNFEWLLYSKYCYFILYLPIILLISMAGFLNEIGINILINSLFSLTLWYVNTFYDILKRYLFSGFSLILFSFFIYLNFFCSRFLPWRHKYTIGVLFGILTNFDTVSFFSFLIVFFRLVILRYDNFVLIFNGFSAKEYSILGRFLNGFSFQKVSSTANGLGSCYFRSDNRRISLTDYFLLWNPWIRQISSVI